MLCCPPAVGLCSQARLPHPLVPRFSPPPPPPHPSPSLTRDERWRESERERVMTQHEETKEDSNLSSRGCYRRMRERVARAAT